MKLRYLQIASSICITCCHLGMSHPALASQTYSKMLTKEYVVTKKNVNGTIVDKDGNPLIGVTIFEKGTDNGCITDFNGQYQLSLSNRDAVIVISYVGYKTQELKETSWSRKLCSKKMQLRWMSWSLSDTPSRKERTDRFNLLTQGQRQKLSVTTSLDQMMQGNLSGVNITNASGMPGGAVRVSIRGVGSINGSNEPLFVIDGIPVSNSDNSGVNGRFGGSVQNPLSMLNPNDIESIDVLKDAAATAIYGSRATNGVVMVTTKRGKKGQRTTVNLSASYGLQSLPKEIEMADSDLYLTVRNEAVNNYNTQNNLKPGDNLYKTLEVNPVRDNPIQTGSISLLTTKQPYKTTRFRFPAVAKRRVSTLLWDTSTRKVLSLRTDSGDIHSAPMSTTTSPTPSRLGCPLHSAKPLTTAFPMTTSATASLHAPSSSGRLMCRSKKMEDT